MVLTGFILALVVGIPLIVVVAIVVSLFKQIKGSMEDYEENNENHREDGK